MQSDLPSIETPPDLTFASLIRSRRTIHNYTDEGPPEGLIAEAIELACQAPNHKLTEPWRYYHLGPETIEKVIELNTEVMRELKGEKAAENKRARWQTMPAWLVITHLRDDNEVRDLENYAAVCCAVQNMSLFLWDNGIGMKWATGPVTRDPRFYEVLGIDQEAERVVGLFWYGYPAEVPTSPREPGASFTKRLP